MSSSPLENNTNLEVKPKKREQEIKSESLYSIAWKQFIKHPMARFALWVLGILYLLSAFADFIAPYPEAMINPKATFQPPSQIHWRDADGNFSRPFVYEMKNELDLDPDSPTAFQKIWTEDKDTPYPINFFVQREGVRERYVPFPVNLIPVGIRRPLGNAMGLKPPGTLHLFGVDSPGDKARVHLWGSDDVGADVFSKILFGGRISLTIGILGSFASILIGMILGGIAGYFGGFLDEIIMRIEEALSAIPGIFLLLLLSSIFYPLDWPPTYVFIAIILALSLTGWGGIARSIRGLVLSLREQEFALAAKSLGASTPRIIFKHLLPQTLNFIVITASLSIPGFILLESVLSFYGLGIQAPATSWGLMLNTAQGFAGVTSLGDRWWIFIPGVFIFIAVITWNLFGDGLRDAIDPRSRK